jgi:chromosome segregation ATPase
MPALLPSSEIAGLLADLSSPIDPEVALSESFSDDDDGLEDLLSPYPSSPDEASSHVASASRGPRPLAESAGLSAGAGPSDAGASIELVHEELRALRADNSTLKRKLKLLQANEQAELRTYRASVEAAQSRTRDEVRSLREALVRLQAEMPALRQKLAHTKSSFAALRISSEEYRKIISTPEEQTSVVEYVQARVHEVLTQAEAPIEQLRSAHTAAAVAQTGIAAQLSSEGAHRAAAESQVRQLKAELVQLRDELDATRLKLSEERMAAVHKSGRGGGTETESLLEAHDKVAVAEARLEEVRADAKRAAEAADHLARDSAAREQMLGLDKSYLSTQLEAERQKLVLAEAELSRREGRMAELKAEKDAM